MKPYYKNDSTTLYNGDCLEVMKNLIDNNVKVDKIITSPPYNIIRPNSTDRGYDLYNDGMTNKEYVDWIISIFKLYNQLLNKNGCVMFNMSYGTENTTAMNLVIAEILKQTNFTLADIIVWKKKSATPNNVSSNKMTRIVEFIYVFCRADEFNTFTSNKKILSNTRKTGQSIYENVFNFFIAKNNDYSQDLNKATFSYDFVFNLIDRYVLPTDIVLDNFSGIGTTIKACSMRNIKSIGIELSEKQCEFTTEVFKNGIQKTLF